MITLTTTAKLVARNGRVIHATAPHCQGVALCAPNMASQGYVTVQFMELTSDKAPVTCRNCCRKLGIEAPKSLPTLKAVKTWMAEKPKPTVSERETEIEAQRAAELDNTAARLAWDAGVRTEYGESYAAWLTKGTVEYRELMDTFHVEAAREYAWSLKLAAKMAKKGR